MKILVTGGTGFIGAHVVEYLVAHGHQVGVAARSTYASKMRNLQDVLPHVDVLFGDLAEFWFADQCADWGADLVVHMAAETHVDRAIRDPLSFMRSNVLGTAQLLQALAMGERPPQKVVVYSTDEVLGSTPWAQRFAEDAPYNPSNAYAASKMAVEGIARSFGVTHGFPVVVVRPCNTYGPRQHPEKVIPKFVRQRLHGEAITVYNDGRGARDWLHVDDHARAIDVILRWGAAGETYHLCADDEHTDKEIAERIIALVPGEKGIRYVAGRPGHDKRYALVGDKLRALGWRPEVPFDEGFAAAVQWNVDHQDWFYSDMVRRGDTSWP